MTSAKLHRLLLRSLRRLEYSFSIWRQRRRELAASDAHQTHHNHHTHRPNQAEGLQAPEAGAPARPLPLRRRLGEVVEPLGIGVAAGVLLAAPTGRPYLALLLPLAAVLFVAGVVLASGPVPPPAYSRSRPSLLAD